jgi:alkanesulfonate monooxygenase SsuD/methylene tetrahydromethanopterin reductase-like flavin-dependent oxidoreductase (luciferase family)
MDFGGNPYTLSALTKYVSEARRLGMVAVAANDHMVFSTPWLDGPTALAAVIDASGAMDLATTVSLPIVRGPVQLAKTLGAIDRLSDGRMLVTVGPGSSERDYEAVGVEFEERWQRLDESVLALRSLWNPEADPFVGRFYSTEGIHLRPPPIQADGPPIWIGSWGSPAGLRRTARLGDGWLASAYNTDPAGFEKSRLLLHGYLEREGRDPTGFPNALATMWFYITDDESEADRIIREKVIPTIHRPEEVLRERLPIGRPEDFIAKLEAFRNAGVQRVYVWPIADETVQIRAFMERVAPFSG